ncbi:NADH dehydrogenase [ubiquinone] 1 alpha subcomplex assembly factor 2 [Varanus komodoensis]|nr:NADH dehydrogenase [ubiquinone] 1 alpha subcomplex assembly factor 2 [Varanus komodoensis]
MTKELKSNFSLPGHPLPAPSRKPGQIIKERRFMENVGMKEYQYKEGNIPTEWEAWIRKKRKDPPTIEEILKNLDYKDDLKRKINELEENEKLLRAKDHEEECAAEPLQIQVKGHASSHHYGKNEPSEEPVSTANTFQPGAWMPSKDSARNK